LHDCDHKFGKREEKVSYKRKKMSLKKFSNFKTVNFKKISKT
jgi:hypothetical protein